MAGATWNDIDEAIMGSEIFIQNLADVHSSIKFSDLNKSEATDQNQNDIESNFHDHWTWTNKILF